MVMFGLYLPCSWDDWSCITNFAYCSILYGNGILFCKKLETITSMVHRNWALQKAFRKLCREKSNDIKDKILYYRNRYNFDGNWIYFNEKCTNWQNYLSRCLARTYTLFLPSGRNTN